MSGAEEVPQGGEPLAAGERVGWFVERIWGDPPKSGGGRRRNTWMARAVDATGRVEPAVLRADTKAELEAKVRKYWPSAKQVSAKPYQEFEGDEAPRGGEPLPSAREEATPVPAEDAVPWVRITRDPEKYEEGMKRAREIGPINSGREIYDLLSPALSVENQEVFLVVLCNLRQECIGVAEVHRGERSRVSVSRADILQIVTKSGADHFHVVHNHPSGDPTPSPADRKLTDAIMSGGDNVDIPCVDHVVIGMGKYYSFAKGKIVRVK
jgi:proteasome lid subunit RPN8/RPN11